MSAVVPNNRRDWMPAAAAVAVSLAGAVAVSVAAALWLLPGRATIPSSTSETGHSSGPAAEIDQARWDVRTYPAGALGRISNKDKKVVAAQRSEIAAVVTQLYDALFLHPERRAEVADRVAMGPAGQAIRSSDAGLPTEVTDVKTLKRSAEIGVEVDGGHAAASVEVRAKGVIDGRPVKALHTATLWLERADGRWRVIGFDFDQRRLK